MLLQKLFNGSENRTSEGLSCETGVFDYKFCIVIAQISTTEILNIVEIYENVFTFIDKIYNIEAMVLWLLNEKLINLTTINNYQNTLH